MTIVAADERRHGATAATAAAAAAAASAAAAAGGLAETWRFDVADPATGFGALVRLAFRPVDRTAWWWVAAVGCGPALVSLRAHDVAIPPRGTEIRTDGLWASLRCETPLEHWSVGVECFGVAYDDPWEAHAGERGDVIPFGLDLEWEGDGAPTARPGGGGYGQWCGVTGELLLGDRRIDVTATGHREHAWGSAADLSDGSRRVRTGDGRRLWGGAGWLVDERGAPVEAASLELTPVAVCPFAVPGRPWVEALCRADGGGGGWVGGVYTRS